MERFIGTKIILATKMTLGDYNKYRGWQIPPDEDPNTPGYLVEYTDGGKPNLPGHPGYVSWSPAPQFENAYRRLDNLTFGHAIEAVKKGYKVARAGWNGKGMWIALSPGSPSLPAEKFWAPPNRQYAEEQGGAAQVLPCITMKTATGEILMGWLASQTDMLAEDWAIVT